MKARILGRMAETAVALLAVASAVFFMVRFVPGGPFDRERTVTEETIERINAYYGLDKPLYEQYFSFLKNLAKGELGPSYKYPGWNVGEILREKAAVSLQLGITALVIAAATGIAAGIAAAVFPKGVTGAVLSFFSVVGVCLPSFVLGPLLILLFSLKLGALNPMGWSCPSDMILPSATLALFHSAWIAKLARDGVVREKFRPYVRTAYAKGLPPSRIYLVHILRNGLEPVISYLGPAAAELLTGSFVVETIFQIPGLGKFFISSALDNDYTMIMGCVMLYAVFVMLFNLLSDIALAVANPKIAGGEGRK